jgi:hypothetical protein
VGSSETPRNGHALPLAAAETVDPAFGEIGNAAIGEGCARNVEIMWRWRPQQGAQGRHPA